ncbi:MAG: hypothetical protein WC884_01510 [Candidatus Paceibacterota bacterium]
MKKVVKKVKAEFDESIHYSTHEMNRYLGALNEVHGETLKGIRENFIVVNRKLDSHSEMIGSLVENMEIVKGDISVIKGDLKKKVDYDDFLSLVRRVQKIEAKI